MARKEASRNSFGGCWKHRSRTRQPPGLRAGGELSSYVERMEANDDFEDESEEDTENQDDGVDQDDHYEDFLLEQGDYAESVRGPLWAVIDAALLQGLPSVQRLSHYTSLDGLRGIAHDKAVFVSETSFMNDPSEWTYALGVIDEAWALLAGTCPDTFAADALAAIRRISTEKSRPRAFIACFTEQDDLLSQWRGYGTGSACSVNIEFVVPEFNEIGRRDPGRRLNRDDGAPRPTSRLLRPVIYDRATQERVVSDVVRTWISAVTSAHHSGGYFPTTGGDGAAIRRDALIESLLPVIPYLKSPAYSAEQEWRLSIIGDIWQQQHYFRKWGSRAANHLTVEYRSSWLGPVPFMRWPITTSLSQSQVPIKEVVLGPECSIGPADVELMLMIHSHFDISVRRSVVPYRGR